MMDNVRQVTATREAGRVRRCHAVPHHGQYTIAEHCYGALNLLLLLHPSPSLALIKAVQWHDVAERWLGDLPATAKWDEPEFGALYEKIEANMLQRLGLATMLTGDEPDWLRAVDVLDLYLWCQNELVMGNRHVMQMNGACESVFYQLRADGKMPEAVTRFIADYKHDRTAGQRLPDRFSSVA